jgi:hypothetical protein
MRWLALILVAGCGGKAPPTVGNTHRGGSQAIVDATEDCTARIESWKPGNHDRYAFEDPKTKRSGFKTRTGKVVIPARYAAVYAFSPMGVAAVIDQASSYLFIDVSGKQLARAYAVDSGPDYFQEGHARIWDQRKRIGFMSDRGKIVIPPKFDAAASFCRGKAEVELEGETFYIDKQGNKTTPPPVDEAK